MKRVLTVARDLADAVVDRRIPVRDVRTGEERRLSARGSLLECEAGSVELLDWTKQTCDLLLREAARLQRDEAQRLRGELAAEGHGPRVYFGGLEGIGQWLRRQEDDVPSRFR